jgi:hypothetical protein
MTLSNISDGAIECSRLSQTLPDAIARETFAAMAKLWVKLAAELRRAAVLDLGAPADRSPGCEERPLEQRDLARMSKVDAATISLEWNRAA